ncbi:hypothetical protein NW754_016592, partial [Fusarium falciforme]
LGELRSFDFCRVLYLFPSSLVGVGLGSGRVQFTSCQSPFANLFRALTRLRVLKNSLPKDVSPYPNTTASLAAPWLLLVHRSPALRAKATPGRLCIPSRERLQAVFLRREALALLHFTYPI